MTGRIRRALSASSSVLAGGALVVCVVAAMLLLSGSGRQRSRALAGFETLGRAAPGVSRSEPPKAEDLLDTGPSADPAAGAADQGERTLVAEETTKGQYRKLTPEEERIIVHKGTEPAFSGEYNELFAKGIYTCRRCGAMLYRSDDKFPSHCGWPSFDDEIPGAVKRLPDADGLRTEVICANCGAHLGHVFVGEHLTAKDTRHCVNSLSLLFVPQDKVKYGRAILAGGCFWGVEYWLQQVPGVLRATSGYIGGTKENPTYEEVCSHTTGHAEAVEVLYDPKRVTFEKLAKTFFDIHDPTQADGQGPDIGDQYRSEIFYTDEAQAEVARKLIAELKAQGLNVVTRVTPAGKFWPAEGYHQDYYFKKGTQPYCHFRRNRW